MTYFPETKRAWARFTDALGMVWHWGSFNGRDLTYVSIVALTTGIVIGICIGRLI